MKTSIWQDITEDLNKCEKIIQEIKEIVSKATTASYSSSLNNQDDGQK